MPRAWLDRAGELGAAGGAVALAELADLEIAAEVESLDEYLRRSTALQTRE